MNDNGIVINLNRINKADFRKWLKGRDKAADRDLWDAEHLYTKVITAWPWHQPISREGYDALGTLDALAVDEAVSAALESLGKKKSAT